MWRRTDRDMSSLGASILTAEPISVAPGGPGHVISRCIDTYGRAH